jgi:hypothetical protein
LEPSAEDTTRPLAPGASLLLKAMVSTCG